MGLGLWETEEEESGLSFCTQSLQDIPTLASFFLEGSDTASVLLLRTPFPV